MTLKSLSAWRAWIEIIVCSQCVSQCVRSLSAWRAWIEMMMGLLQKCTQSRRSPLGERGLKSEEKYGPVISSGRSPLGERGLKFSCRWCYRYFRSSLSAWRAWIEIKLYMICMIMTVVALRLESEGLKSHIRCIYRYASIVALRLESVD